MNTAKTPMTKEQAYKELAKVGVILGALENGAISLMSDKQVEQVLEWLN